MNITDATNGTGIIEERESRIVFGQIDPLIRLLLASINQSSSSKSNIFAGEKGREEEEILLSNLRIQQNLLVKLANIFESFYSTERYKDEEEASRNSGTGGCDTNSSENITTVREEVLVKLAEYILLPLTQILRGGIGRHKSEQQQRTNEGGDIAANTSTKSTDIDDGEKSALKRKAWIRKSAQRKCMEQSAIALASYLKAIEYKLNHQKIPDRDEKIEKEIGYTPSKNDNVIKNIETKKKEYSSTKQGSRLKPHIIAQSLITCAVALQSLEDDCDDFVDDQNQESHPNDKSLDDAVACTKSILHCVESLVSYGSMNKVSEISSEQKSVKPSHSQSHSGDKINVSDNYNNRFNFPAISPNLSPTAIEITNVMDGALLARLADACLSPLFPSSPVSSQRRRPKSYHHDASLKIQSLVTLRAMMYHVPSIETWRALFPGCFARLFKASVLNLDGVPTSSSSSSSPSHRVASISIETLSSLIDLVIADSSFPPSPVFPADKITKDSNRNDKKNNDHSCNDGDIMPPTDVAASEALTTLAAIATTQNIVKRIGNDERSKSATKKKSVSGNNNGDYSSFSQQQECWLTFFKKMSKRIPKPLSMLLNMIPAHRSKLVRRSGCSLCRSVMELVTIAPSTSAMMVEQISSAAMTTKMHQQTKVEEIEEGSKKDEDVIEINLERISLECCLALTEDEDPLVVSTSRRVISSYCSLLGPELWKTKVNDNIIVRIVELTKELPILAQRVGGVGREADLVAEINLISGYLKLAAIAVDKTDSKRNHLKGKKQRRRRCGRGCDIGDNLACEGISFTIRKALTEILALDLDSTAISTSAMQLFSNTKFRHDTVDGYSADVSVPRFLYLRSYAASEAAKKMVRLFGFALGAKHVVNFVDNCIGDLFHACSERASSKERGATLGVGMSLLCMSDQVDWLHRWCGSLILSNELLLGLLSPEVEAEEYVSGFFINWPSIMDNIASDSQYYETSLDRKATKRIIKLTSSILPIMTSAPLWNLPTTTDEVDCYAVSKKAERCNSNHRSINVFLPAHNSDRPLLAHLGHGQSSVWSGLSVSALNGNAILTGFLIDIVGSLTKLLGNNIRPFLPTLLYPLIEKSSISSHYVQKSAQIVLERVAGCTGAVTVHSLVVQNFDYLAEKMISNAHSLPFSVCPKKQLMVPRSLPGIVEKVLKSVVKEIDVADHDTMILNPSMEHCFGSRYISLFGDLVYKVATLFDQSFTKKSDEISLVRVFGTVIDYLQLSMKYYKDGNINSSISDMNTEHTWLDLLSEFSENDESQFNDVHDKKDKICPAEGFAQYHNSKMIDECASGERTIHEKKSSDFCPQGVNRLFEEEIKIANLILSRCCFFLYSPDLIMQVATCKTLVSAFGYLAAIQKQLTATAVSNESVGNPLLASIGELWPSIIDRFCSAAISLMEEKSIKTLGTSAQKTVCSKGDPESGDEIYFAHLLSVISAVCEFSGDFMVGRIKNEVWPYIAKLLGIMIEVNVEELVEGTSREKPSAIATITDDVVPRCSATMEDKQIARHAILKFLLCVFSNRDCANNLSDLVPAACSLILPLISNEDSIGSSAFLALKAMLSVDSDGIFRALLALSGLGISSKPLVAPNPNVSLVGIAETDDILVGKVKELVNYAGGLPEHIIN